MNTSRSALSVRSPTPSVASGNGVGAPGFAFFASVDDPPNAPWRFNTPGRLISFFSSTFSGTMIGSGGAMIGSGRTFVVSVAGISVDAYPTVGAYPIAVDAYPVGPSSGGRVTSPGGCTTGGGVFTSRFPIVNTNLGFFTSPTAPPLASISFAIDDVCATPGRCFFARKPAKIALARSIAGSTGSSFVAASCARRCDGEALDASFGRSFAAPGSFRTVGTVVCFFLGARAASFADGFLCLPLVSPLFVVRGDDPAGITLALSSFPSFPSVVVVSAVFAAFACCSRSARSSFLRRNSAYLASRARSASVFSVDAGFVAVDFDRFIDIVVVGRLDGGDMTDSIRFVSIVVE